LKFLENISELVGLNKFDVWDEVVLGAELKALFGVFDSSDQRSSDRFSLEDKWKL